MIKRNLFKSLFILSTIILTISIFVSCSEKTKEEKRMKIVFDGKTDYTIVRSDDSDELESEAAKKLRNSIKEKTDTDIAITTDYVSDEKNIEVERRPYEIIVGKTNREESCEVVTLLEGKRYEFIIKVFDEKHIVITGSTSEATSLGVDYFIENYINATDRNIIINASLDQYGEYDYPINSLKIEGNPINEYVIVHSDSASNAEKNAAEALQSYIWMAAGHKLSIVSDTADKTEKEILVGNTNRIVNEEIDSLKDEEYLISTEGMSLVLVGGSDRGTLYGVYGFLEKYIGWNYYTPKIEDCDINDDVNITSVNEKVSPAFSMRDLYTVSAQDPLWCVKNGINGNIFRTIPESLGGSVRWIGAQAHNIGTLAETGNDKNPCLTDTNIYLTVLKNTGAILEKNPDAEIFSISQLDGVEFCKCKNCTEFMTSHGNTPSALILQFINKIADELKNDYPELKIETLAYLETLPPPENIKASDNVIVRFCPITAVRSDAMNDKTSIVNLGFCVQLNEWRKICKNVYIWDYTTAFHQQFCAIPNIFDLDETIEYYYDLGIPGVMMQGFPRGDSPEFGELRCFLMAKLLQNPKMDEDEYTILIKKFLNAYYGAGWENIYDYLNFLEECSSGNHIAYDPTAYQLYNKDKFLSRIDEFNGKWDKAEDLAPNDMILGNIKRTRLGFTYLTLELSYSKNYTSGNNDSRKAYSKAAAEFFQTIRTNGMWMMETMKLPQNPNFALPPSQWQ